MAFEGYLIKIGDKDKFFNKYIKEETYKVSKKGNKIARSIIFLIVRSMVRKKVKDNPIKQYYYKKKAQPNIIPKVALFACVNKFIRMIHSLCKNGLIYEYSITQK